MAFKILSPCGILGYGYPITSFMAGMDHKPDAIVVDAGSTDAGPHKLGAGVAIVSKEACKKDLLPLITQGIQNKIPVIIGSAGGSGAKTHVNWTLSIIQEIIEEQHLSPVKLAIIWGDIPNEVVKERLAAHQVSPLGKTVPELTPEVIDKTNGIVAQMGAEPIIEALSNQPDIIICGRAYDPSPFAAPAIAKGYNPALAYHLGKILECAALCCEPGTTKDCMLGVIEEDCFEVYPLNPLRKCTKVSVAAHTFYEKEHPYLLKGPGITMDLSQCHFEEIENNGVRVSGSQLTYDQHYRIKLEGAMPVAFRTFVIAGIRDPLLIAQLEEVEALVKKQVQDYYAEINPDTYHINFINYGINGVMGDIEPVKARGHEVAVLMEVLAPYQEQASAICASLRSTFLHYGYDGRKSTAGNLAFPFAPSDINFGPVYAFSIYHLMDVKDGTELFKTDYMEV